MTRKEKINQLNDIFAEINEDDYLTSEDKIIEWKKDFKEYVNSLSMPRDDYKGIMEYIDELPVTSEPCEDAISRKWLVEALEAKGFSLTDTDYNIMIHLIRDTAPSVQPKYNASEWCKTCKEYNQDKHCCPRYNGVIRKAVEEIKEPKVGHWIYENYNWRCSECNEPPKTMGYVGTSDFMTEHFKFCNHCGARMIKPQESEDKE